MLAVFSRSTTWCNWAGGEKTSQLLPSSAMSSAPASVTNSSSVSSLAFPFSTTM